MAREATAADDHSDPRVDTISRQSDGHAVAGLLILIGLAHGGGEHPAGAQHVAGWKDEMVCRFYFSPSFFFFLNQHFSLSSL